MEKVLYDNSFDAENMKLTVNDLLEVEKERIVAVWDVSRARAILNRRDIVPDVITVSGNVITLSKDMCKGISSEDKIIVVYDVPEIRNFTLLSDQSLSQDGSSDVILGKYYDKVLLCCVVSSVSGGTPSLTLSVVGVDVFGNERILVTSDDITSVGTYWLDAELGVFERFKVVWSISGELPSFVVSVFIGLKV
jgi:hypothetical protein